MSSWRGSGPRSAHTANGAPPGPPKRMRRAGLALQLPLVTVTWTHRDGAAVRVLQVLADVLHDGVGHLLQRHAVLELQGGRSEVASGACIAGARTAQAAFFHAVQHPATAALGPGLAAGSASGVSWVANALPCTRQVGPRSQVPTGALCCDTGSHGAKSAPARAGASARASGRRAVSCWGTCSWVACRWRGRRSTTRGRQPWRLQGGCGRDGA